MPEPSDPFALYRISVQITNSQYELLNKHKKPGTSISELIFFKLLNISIYRSTVCFLFISFNILLDPL